MLDFATDLLKFFFQENIPCPKSPEKIKTVKSKRQKQGKVNIYGEHYCLLWSTILVSYGNLRPHKLLQLVVSVCHSIYELKSNLDLDMSNTLSYNMQFVMSPLSYDGCDEAGLHSLLLEYLCPYQVKAVKQNWSNFLSEFVFNLGPTRDLFFPYHILVMLSTWISLFIWYSKWVNHS